MLSIQHSRAMRVTTESCRNRLRAVVRAIVHMDYELRNFDPALYQMYRSSRFLNLREDDQASHWQSIRLRASFNNWRRRFISPRDEQHDLWPKASNEPRTCSACLVAACDKDGKDVKGSTTVNIDEVINRHTDLQSTIAQKGVDYVLQHAPEIEKIIASLSRDNKSPTTFIKLTSIAPEMVIAVSVEQRPSLIMHNWGRR